MNCPKCKAELPDKAKFCLECGANISSISGESKQEQEPSLGDLRTMAPPRVAPLYERGGSGGADAPSIGDVRTMGGGADAPSIGDLRTMTGPGDAKASGDVGAKGTVLGDRYELIEEIGRGGFAVVWKARDKKLDRVVAVKRLLAAQMTGSGAKQTLARFEREARAIAGLNHRNIVQVFDHDRDGDGQYVVMEYVEGGTLRDYVKAQGGKLEVEEAVRLIRGVAQGLAYAHKKNLVHRDIKPSNILLHQECEEITPKIVDFGLARMGSESELSQSGYGMGTPYYMPPEQRRDAKNVNHTADIYALGKTLYFLITGEVPDQVDPEKLPPALGKVILKCVKTNPEERYFSADDRPGSVAPTAAPPAAVESRELDVALKLLGWPTVVEKQRFLLEKFLGFQGELKASGIEVCSVDHYEYQERYLLKRGSEMACIQVYYDARGRFTRIQPKPITGASAAVQQAGIEAFQRAIPVALAAPAPVPPEFPPDKSFLKDCYEQIIGQLQPHGICVDRVEHRDYAERYHVTRGGETAVFDVWYNANGQGTSVKALSALGNSEKLLNDLQAILKS